MANAITGDLAVVPLLILVLPARPLSTQHGLRLRMPSLVTKWRSIRQS
jgi:hypothetical protein